MVAKLRDVAAKANVSVGTASMILNGKERGVRISAATCARVLKAAEELQYQPNPFARSLRTQKSNTIGVCAAYLYDQYTATILQYVNRAAHHKGYRLMLSFLEEQEDPVQTIREAFGTGYVDGVLIRESADKLDDQSILKLHKEGMKMVLVGREIVGSSIPTVLYDNFQGGYMAAEHLLKLGHERIAIAMENDPLGKKRSEGACAALDKRDDSEVLFVDICSPEEISSRGYQAGTDILHMQNRPTAIIAHDDVLAFGIISAVKAEGLRVPEDIAIVGFNDMANISAYYDPPLTSIRPPYAEMGGTAVDLLVDIMDGRLAQDAGTKILLNPSLIARKSSGVSCP